LEGLGENNTRSAEIFKMSQSISGRDFLGYNGPRHLIPSPLPRCATGIRDEVGSDTIRFDVAEFAISELAVSVVEEVATDTSWCVELQWRPWGLHSIWRNGTIWTTRRL
jgi:hypothetical protein